MPMCCLLDLSNRPFLATLVLIKSPVAVAIERAISNGVNVSVYMDDFIGSHSDAAILERAYADIRDASISAGLVPNPDKLVPPTQAIAAFNCELSNGRAVVSSERIAKYYTDPDRPFSSDASFQQYCELVASANIPQTSELA